MTNSRPDANAGTFAALLGLGFAGLLLLGMVAIVLPQALGLMLVIAFFGMIISIQYVLLYSLRLSQQLLSRPSKNVEPQPVESPLPVDKSPWVE